MTDDIKIALWDEEQFAQNCEEWTVLLNRSKSDKLFMSWEWLYSWWTAFSSKHDMSLYIIAAYNNKDTLVGIAPLYLSSVVSKKILATRRLQFIGNCWRGPITMRTELLDFIVDSAVSTQVIKALFEFINKTKNWDEFVLSDLDKNSETYSVLIKEKSVKNTYYRVAEEFDSFYLSLQDNFEIFCKSLGKNTRLKLLNRRKVLESLGDVTYSELKSNDIESNFKLLNDLHQQRWGIPVFENECLEFNLSLARLMAMKGQLQFSILSLDDKPISIQYNYIVDRHEYNIQAGFIEDLHSKISLGYLHFGYAIESSFKNGCYTYDFLAGEGKNTQYKARLTKNALTIVSLQLIRSQPAKTVYYLYDVYNKLVSN